MQYFRIKKLEFGIFGIILCSLSGCDFCS